MVHHLKRFGPSLLFVASLGAACLWYLWDAASLSTRATNLVLILPATLIGVLLCVVVAIEEIVEKRRHETTRDAGERSVDPSADAPPEDAFNWRIPMLMVLVGVFIAVALTVGFDVAVLAFCAAALTLLGERRLWVIVAYPVAFAVVVVGGLKVTLSYDIPMLLF